MTERIWLASYPPGVPADIDVSQYASVVALMEESFRSFGPRVAYTFMGKDVTYAQTDSLSQAFGAYLQSLGLARGDRVAVMMPNVPQYPVVVAAILRAGLVLVNINPLYTARELEHQLKDSGSKAIIILENFAATLEKCIAASPVKHVVLCAMGDQLGLVKGTLVNYVVRHSKKLVPAFSLAGAVRYNDAIARGTAATLKKPVIKPDDVAVLQYTGGTTGVSKGAVLLHRNLVANVLQNEIWAMPLMNKIPKGEQPTSVCALPLYHIFAFTYCMMLSMRLGGKLILIPNPRDLPAMFKELSKHRIHLMPAVNTLFNGMANHPDFKTVDWSHLIGSTGGGTAVQSSVAKLWREKTGSPILEGYGLSETSPTASGNPANATEYSGSIGVPLPNTWMKLLDDDGVEVDPWPTRRDRHQGPPGDGRLLAAAGRNRQGHDPGRLLQVGRHRHHGRTRFLQNCRPQEGHGAGQRLQCVPDRAGRRRLAARRRARMCLRRCAGRQDRRGRQAGDREEELRPERGRRTGLLPREPHRLQATQDHRVPHRAAQDAGGQDPAPRTARQIDTTTLGNTTAILSALAQEQQGLIEQLEAPRQVHRAGAPTGWAGCRAAR